MLLNRVRPNIGSSLNTSIILDPFNKEVFDQIFSIHEINGHMYALASTRSGKTEFIKLVFIRLYQKNDASIVIMDPHGDLAKQCMRMLNNKKHYIFIDPTLKKGFTPTINPFRLKNRDEETISSATEELVSAFQSILKEDFSSNMEVLLTVLIYILLSKGDSGIDELVRILDDENNEDLLEYASTIKSKYHRDFMKHDFKKSKFNKTKDALSTKLQIFLASPIFRHFVTGDSTFDLEEALNNKMTIIFRFPKGKMKKTLEPAAKLIMALIQGIVFRRSDLPEEERPKTVLICDEFQNFFSQISEEILSESGKNNLSIIMAHQYLSQLDTKSRDGVLSGANIHVVGKNSNKDLTSIAKEMGIDPILLKNLKKGEFYVKVGSNEAIKILTTDKYLGSKLSVSDYELKKNLKYQRKKFYKKIDVEENDVPNKVEDNTSNINSSLPIPRFNIGDL